MRLLRGSLLTGLVIVLLLDGALLPADAASGSVRARAHTSAAFTAPGWFHGKIASHRKPCRTARVVTLVADDGRVVGRTRSRASGRWSISYTPPAAGGSYHAKVARRRAGRLVCTKARSARVSVPARSGTPAASGPQTLSISLPGSGQGTVTSTPTGLSCQGTTCTGTWAHGTWVTLSADPSTGSTFTGWGGACAGTSACTLSMTQARSVTATFDLLTAPVTTPVTQPLTVIVAGTVADAALGGLVTSTPVDVNCATTCTTDLAQGTVATLTATALPGFTFTGWSGDCAGAGATCQVVLDRARTVTATFAALPGLPILG